MKEHGEIMVGYLGKNRINIVNDSGTFLDDSIWISTSYGSFLLKFSLERKVLEYVTVFEKIEFMFHPFTNMVAYGRCLYLIPGYSDYIVKYNVDTKRTKYVKLKNNIDERIYSRVAIYNNKLFIFSSQSEKVYVYNLLDDELQCNEVNDLSNVKYAYVKIIDNYICMFSANAKCEVCLNLDDLSVVNNKEKNNLRGDLFLNSDLCDIVQNHIDGEKIMEKVNVGQKINNKTYIFFNCTAEYGLIESGRLLLKKFPDNFYMNDEARFQYDYVLENGMIHYLLPRYGNMVIQLHENGIELHEIKMDDSVLNYIKRIYSERKVFYEGCDDYSSLMEFLTFFGTGLTKEKNMDLTETIGVKVFNVLT